MSSAIKADEFGFALTDWSTAKERLNATLAITERIQKFTMQQGKGCCVYVTITAIEDTGGFAPEGAEPDRELEL